MDPRAKRQKIADPSLEDYKETIVKPLTDPAQIEALQKIVFHEVLMAKQRMTSCLAAAMLDEKDLASFDEVYGGSWFLCGCCDQGRSIVP